MSPSLCIFLFLFNGYTNLYSKDKSSHFHLFNWFLFWQNKIKYLIITTCIFLKQSLHAWLLITPQMVPPSDDNCSIFHSLIYFYHCWLSTFVIIIILKKKTFIIIILGYRNIGTMFLSKHNNWWPPSENPWGKN